LVVACRFEERLEAADRRRIQGNDLFRAGDAAGAAAKYGLALSFLDEDFLMQLEGPHLDQVRGSCVCCSAQGIYHACQRHDFVPSLILLHVAKTQPAKPSSSLLRKKLNHNVLSLLCRPMRSGCQIKMQWQPATSSHRLQSPSDVWLHRRTISVTGKLHLQVLTSQPDNSKALFRRGRAQLRLGNTEAAERDLSHAARLAPDDPAIRKVADWLEQL
jgi:hypothetical protein